MLLYKIGIYPLWKTGDANEMRFNMDSFSDVFERVKQLCRGEMSEVAYDL